MSRVSKYWMFIEPDGRTIESIEARSWFYEKFPDSENHSDSSDDRAIQRWLVEIWKDKSLSDTTDWQRADYCLRCLISLWLRADCGELAYCYSGKGFNKEDLYHLVLEDTLKIDRDSFTGKQPLAWQILDKFDPSKSSSLSSFTKLRMRQYKPLLNFLNEKGCRIGSSTPWALLNNIEKITKLKRILCNSGVFIPERSEALHKIWCVLESYHAIYRNDLIEQKSSHAGKPFPPPTAEQLQRMVDYLKEEHGFTDYTPKKIKDDLLALAEKAQEYTYKKPPHQKSIDALTNNTSSGSIDASEDSTTNLSDFLRDPNGKDPYEEIEEKEEKIFLRKCDQAFLESLDEAIKQIINQYIPEKQKQRQRSLQAHCLFYCEGKSYKEIAIKLGTSDKTIATDLQPQARIHIDYRSRRRTNNSESVEAEQQATDIRHKTIELLCKRVKELGSVIRDISQLQQLDREIRDALEEIITPKFDQAIAELFTPNNSSKRSLVNVQICYYVKKLRGELGL